MATARKTAAKSATAGQTNRTNTATKTAATTSEGKDATMAAKNETKTNAPAEKKVDGRSNPKRLTPAARAQRDLDAAMKSYSSKKEITDKLQAKADESRVVLTKLEAKVRAAVVVAQAEGLDIDVDELLHGEDVYEAEAPSDEAEAQFAAAEVVED